jgi:hypothetical protein
MADSAPEFEGGLVDVTRTSLAGLSRLDDEIIHNALACLLALCGDGPARLWGEGSGLADTPQAGT